MQYSIKPIVTESATLNSENEKNKPDERKHICYTFRVAPDAHKQDIKALVEDLYGVNVVSVNTQRVRGKNKSRYTKAGLLRGKTDAWKKAYVTLREGQTIDFYTNI